MIEINRKLKPGRHKITDAFPQIRKEQMLVDLFESKEGVDHILDTVEINLIDRPHYMNVNNDDATINIGLGHLMNSEDEVLYLDILHEICHVKQQRNGINLYNRAVPYVDSPTELEAYEFAVKAARKMGLSEKAIFEYLWVEWISPEDHRKLAKRLSVDTDSLW